MDHDSVVRAGAHVGLGSIVKANCTIESGRKVEAGEVSSLRRDGRLRGQTAVVWRMQSMWLACSSCS